MHVSASEVNFDGLVGPTHNYAGLSYGNIAATENALQVSNPREAALQGLAKMRAVRSLGLIQGLLPPHERPHVPTLRRLGFTGPDHAVLAAAWRTDPMLVRNVSSASAMWTANAATVSPGADSADGRVHFTPANLVTMFHRAIEPATTARILRRIFPEGEHFAHHPPLPAAQAFGDEGAANHNRFVGRDYGEPGLQLFVYGRRGFARQGGPGRFPARQSREASEAIARAHQVGRALFVQQSPEAIDAGAFHNDVVAVANGPVFFYHEQAFADPDRLETELKAAAPDIPFHFIRVPAARVSLEEAVRSYLFNSQLLSPPEMDGMVLVLPKEAQESAPVRDYVAALTSGDPHVRRALYLDLRQSMRNGGGPACLRLRVVLTAAQRRALGARVLLDDALYAELVDWVQRHYRDRLVPEDLGDPALLDESRTALDELTQILDLGSVYDFQREPGPL